MIKCFHKRFLVKRFFKNNLKDRENWIIESANTCLTRLQDQETFLKKANHDNYYPQMLAARQTLRSCRLNGPFKVVTGHE